MAASTEGPSVPSENQPISSVWEEAASTGMSHIQQSFEARGLSKKATNLVMLSWRKSTQKQYNSYIKKWRDYGSRQQVSETSPSVEQTLNFLTTLYQSGAGYSALNIARSALSVYLCPVEGNTFGAHPLSVRLLKGVSKQRPSRPRYTDTWDLSIVLSYLRGQMPLQQLGLKKLTQKLIMLIALVTTQRVKQFTS